MKTQTNTKLFIYLAIIVTIAILNNADMIHAKSFSKLDYMTKMDDPPKNPPQASLYSRIRREVGSQLADEDGVPKERFHGVDALRVRRQAPPQESDVPQGFQRVRRQAPPQESDLPQGFQRAKRQMPFPPEQVPMPPM